MPPKMEEFRVQWNLGHPMNGVNLSVRFISVLVLMWDKGEMRLLQRVIQQYRIRLLVMNTSECNPPQNPDPRWSDKISHGLRLVSRRKESREPCCGSVVFSLVRLSKPECAWSFGLCVLWTLTLGGTLTLGTGVNAALSCGWKQVERCGGSHVVAVLCSPWQEICSCIVPGVFGFVVFWSRTLGVTLTLG